MGVFMNAMTRTLGTLADSGEHSAPVTHWLGRILLTLVLLAVLSGFYWLMYRGWQKRAARQQDLPVPHSTRPRVGAGEGGSLRAGLVQPGSAQGGSSLGDSAEPGPTQAGASQAGLPGAGSTSPGSSQAGSSQPSATQSGSLAPASPLPGTLQPAPPQPLQSDRPEPAAAVEGVYASTTTSGNWLDRIAAHGLGVRSNAWVEVDPAGVFIAREAAPDLFIPAADLRGAALAPGIAGKVTGGEGVLLITWQLGDHKLDTGFHPRSKQDRARLLEEINALTNEGELA